MNKYYFYSSACNVNYELMSPVFYMLQTVTKQLTGGLIMYA